MSLYLFILCMERLSRGIDTEVRSKRWDPIGITNGGPKIPHLFFADDPTLLARASPSNYQTIVNILKNLSNLSGQIINNAKSKVLFSKHCTTSNASICTQILNIQVSQDFGKYLGYPIFHSTPKNRDFQFILDNMHQRLEGWKTKFLNLA